jgi:hypothetical protein
MILADFSPPFSAMQLFVWLGILTFLVFLTNGLFKLWNNLKGKPSPGEVAAQASERYQLKGDFATRQELKDLEARIEQMSEAGEDSRQALRDHIDGSMSDLTKKVDDVRKELSASLAEQAKEFGQALRDQPGQIVAILRNTGALK